jgi:N-acetylglucosamine-6-phosphate deacetylase
MSDMEAVSARYLVLDDGVVEGHAVVVADGRIEGIEPVGALPDSLPHRRLGDRYLAPGLVDIHTHGATGGCFNDADQRSFDRALAGLLSAGVTAVLPTIATDDLDRMSGCLELVGAAMMRRGGPRVLGAHLEGPYLASEQRGAQDPERLRSPDDGSAAQLLEQRSAIRIVTLAPELAGALELTAELVQHGIVVAAGHSSAGPEDLRRCARAGLSHITHIYSGQSTTTRQGPWRQPGLLEATLASDELTVEMIGDGQHLPDELMTIAHRCLGERLCVVSDSTPGAGSPEGTRYRMGQVEYHVGPHVGLTLDGTSFGGSTTLLGETLPVLVNRLGLPIHEAVAMTARRPAAIAGAGERLGRLKSGYQADLVALSRALQVEAVAVGGVWQNRETNERRG